MLNEYNFCNAMPMPNLKKNRISNWKESHYFIYLTTILCDRYIIPYHERIPPKDSHEPSPTTAEQEQSENKKLI